jgi:hypothetical protein
MQDVGIGLGMEQRFSSRFVEPFGMAAGYITSQFTVYQTFQLAARG